MKKIFSVIGCVLLLLPAVAAAQVTQNFIVPAGDWDVAANWDSGTVPADGDSAFINNGGEGDLSVDTATILDLGVGQGVGVSGSLVHTAGTLSSADGWIRIGGDGGLGTYEMSGTAALEAVHFNPGDQRVFVGHGGGGDGTLIMSDSASITTSGIFSVGDSGGMGTVTLNDEASVTADGIRFTGSVMGTININDDATFQANSIHLGNPDATINVNQNGGRLTSNNWIGIANEGGGNVVYNISAGQMVSMGDILTVGEDGNGTLNVSGTADIQANGIAMTIGRNDSSIGRLSITGSTATISVNDLLVDNPTAFGNSGGIGWIADAGGVTPIRSLDNTEFGDDAVLVVDLTADANFAQFGPTGTPTEIVLIQNAFPASGTFTGLPEGASVDIGGGKTATISYAGGSGSDIVLDVLVGAGGGGFVPPAAFTVFRGVQLTGAIGDFLASDDVRAEYNPGFTLNDLEAPIWLIFDGNAPSSNEFIVESQAGTPGLTYTMEAWNFTTNAFEIIDTQPESFNVDVITSFPITADNIDSNGDVQSRVGWRQTGFIINFPWVARVDQVGWNQ